MPQQFRMYCCDIGGASLTGLLSPYSPADIGSGGYSDPDSLDGWLVAARIDLKSDAPWKLRLGYSHIGDEADIVAPWRGFPTAGFTRAMGQYNWYANTDTWMLRGDYSFEKAGLVNGLTAMFRIAAEDFDDDKIVPMTDRNVLQLDAIQKIKNQAQTSQAVNTVLKSIIYSNQETHYDKPANNHDPRNLRTAPDSVHCRLCPHKDNGIPCRQSIGSICRNGKNI